ncbi:MAG: MEKHLA domain-containing protein [Nitrospira sp.]|nr:MEKHLA domain-containing protein [Nitrospira sp.]
MGITDWNRPEIIQWCQELLDSYHHWTGRELIERVGETERQARMLFEVPFVVVSHGNEPDPILNYGNQRALDLWELSWDQFTQTPSRLTAEPDDRDERERMLHRAKSDGYCDGYRGVRISSTGRRFLVEQALIWTIIDSSERPIGQAATFSHWSTL